MDFDTVHRDTLSLYPKLLNEENLHIPQIMKYESTFPLGFSSSSNVSGRFLGNLDHFNVPDSGLYTPYRDPFDPFQASFCKLNQEYNIPTSFAQDMHGSKTTRLLDLDDSRSVFHTMDQYQMNDPFFDANDSLEMDSGLMNLDDSVKQERSDNMLDQAAKGGVEKKRKIIIDKKSEIIKGQWTPDEDRLLVELVEKHGERKWSSIAQMLPGRIGKQCRERWHNHLKPNIKKDRWSEEEDRILIEAHRQLGNKWAEIARSLPGRSENTIKNHWNATKRRQLSSRKKNNPKSTSTPLQNYIKSVISTNSSSSREKDNNNYPENNYSSSSSTSPPLGDSILLKNPKQEKICFDSSTQNPVAKAVQESFKLPPSLETQIHMQFDLQKEMDFMEMLSYGYI